MSFFLPVTDRADEKACYASPDTPTSELLDVPGLVEGRAVPIFALWGGGAYCADLLLGAIADEASNRSLSHFSFRSPLEPHRRFALWVEGIGLIRRIECTLPINCRLIDLSPLLQPPSTDEAQALCRLRKHAAALADRHNDLVEAFAKLECSTLAMTADLHDTEKLDRKAERIARAQPIGSGRARHLPVTALTKTGELCRLLPFGEEVQIIGLRELYGVAADWLTRLKRALEAHSADYTELTDALTGNSVGVWLPSGKLCYLIDAPERMQKLMTLSRYLLARPCAIRARYRVLEDCKHAICGEMAYLVSEMAEIDAQISSFEEKRLQKSRLGEYRKRLLIELFCR